MKNEEPLVSVLMPVYNAGEFLRPAVESIINQSHKHLQVILVDDGSTDGCMESIADIDDPRLEKHRIDNSGRAYALNYARERIRGKFWLIQDADDISYSRRVEVMVSVLLDHDDLAAVYSGNDLIYNDRHIAPNYPELSENEVKRMIDSFSMPAHDATGVYRTGMTKDVIFDTDFKIGSGVDYVFKIGECYPVKVIGECLYGHRVNSKSITNQEPLNNHEKIQKVIEKACVRRNIRYEESNCPLKSRKGYHPLLIYFMKSVYTQKAKRMYLSALRQSFVCVSINPLNIRYYKPMLYSILPLFVINFYRSLKN